MRICDAGGNAIRGNPGLCAHQSPSARAGGMLRTMPFGRKARRRFSWQASSPLLAQGGLYGGSEPIIGPRGVAGALEPALAASAGGRPKRRWHGVRGGQDGHRERPGDRGPQSLACTNPCVASVRRDGTGNPEPASSRAATSGAVFRLRPIPTGSLTAPRRVLTVRDSPVAASAFPRTWGVPPGGVLSARLRRRITRSAR